MIAIVSIPRGARARAQEAEMRKAIMYMLATAGTYILVLFAMTVEAGAQNIEN